MKSVLSVLLLVGLFSGISQTRAQEAEKPAESKPVESHVEPEEESLGPRNYLTGLGGYGIVTSGGNSNFPTVGGRIGLGFPEKRQGILSLGIAAQTMKDSMSMMGVTADLRITAVMLEFVARRAFRTGLYIGVRGGLGFLTADVTSKDMSLSGTSTTGVFGPVVGYEFRIIERLSINFDTSWLNITSGDITFPMTQNVHYEDMSAVLIQGGVSFHW